MDTYLYLSLIFPSLLVAKELFQASKVIQKVRPGFRNSGGCGCSLEDEGVLQKFVLVFVTVKDVGVLWRMRVFSGKARSLLIKNMASVTPSCCKL